MRGPQSGAIYRTSRATSGQGVENDEQVVTLTPTIFALTSQTTTRTPARADHDNSLHCFDVVSSSSVGLLQSAKLRARPLQGLIMTLTFIARISPHLPYGGQTPSSHTRTHALYSTQQSSTGVVGATVGTTAMADYDDDMGLSPYHTFAHFRMLPALISPN